MRTESENSNQDSNLISLARQLRKGQTDAEVLLWQLLRNRQLNDLKLRRQHPSEGYIADFYCHELKLVIELDGSQYHTEEGIQRDRERSNKLKALGIKVVRFDNSQVLFETEGVLERLFLLTSGS